MDVLNKLGGLLGNARDVAIQIAVFAAALAIVYVLAGPAWEAVRGLAAASANAMQANGMALLGALGVLGLAKYLSS